MSLQHAVNWTNASSLDSATSLCGPICYVVLNSGLLIVVYLPILALSAVAILAALADTAFRLAVRLSVANVLFSSVLTGLGGCILMLGPAIVIGQAFETSRRNLEAVHRVGLYFIRTSCLGRSVAMATLTVVIFLDIKSWTAKIRSPVLLVSILVQWLAFLLVFVIRLPKKTFEEPIYSDVYYYQAYMKDFAAAIQLVIAFGIELVAGSVTVTLLVLVGCQREQYFPTEPQVEFQNPLVQLETAASSYCDNRLITWKEYLLSIGYTISSSSSTQSLSIESVPNMVTFADLPPSQSELNANPNRLPKGIGNPVAPSSSSDFTVTAKVQPSHSTDAPANASPLNNGNLSLRYLQERGLVAGAPPRQPVAPPQCVASRREIIIIRGRPDTKKEGIFQNALQRWNVSIQQTREQNVSERRRSFRFLVGLCVMHSVVSLFNICSILRDTFEPRKPFSSLAVIPFIYLARIAVAVDTIVIAVVAMVWFKRTMKIILSFRCCYKRRKISRIAPK